MPKNIAIAYSMARKRSKKCASGGMVKSGDKEMDYAEGGEVKSPNDGPVSEEEAKKFSKGLGFAHGGQVNGEPCKACGAPVYSKMEDSHRANMSKGGQVANDTDMSADESPNEFDDLALRDGLEFSYDGKNSGDEKGGPSKDDVVARAMLRKKAKR